MKIVTSRLYILFLLLFVIFTASHTLYAEVSTGTVLFYSDHDSETSTIKILNRDEEPLPLLSGLAIFPGDTLESSEESLVLLVKQKTLVIEVAPFSLLRFGIKNITSRDIVIQILVERGSINITTHTSESLPQILHDIQFPVQVLRNDDREDTLQGLGNIYVHIISDESEVITRNISPSQGIFITKSGVDIEEIINTFNLIERRIAPNKDFLVRPKYTYTTNIHTKLQFMLLFPELGKTQHVASTIFMDIQYKKFHTTLRLPLIFTKENRIYSPFGENDYLSTFQIDHEKYRDQVSSFDKLGLRFEHFVSTVLTKITSLTLATPEDSFYLYYGDQHNWKNNFNTLTNAQKTNSLLVHHYNPVNSFKNNLNKELIVDFNFFYFGNSTRIRHFQAPSILDTWLTRMDLFYNRIWVKPVPTNYPLEIGFTTAIDGHTNKFSKYHIALNSLSKETNTQSYFFYGFDLTLPIVLTTVFVVNSSLEFGQLIPSVANQYIYTAEITNYGSKAGLDIIFLNGEDTFTFGFSTNAYYTKGFFQPHLWFAGYEYSIRSRMNTAIAYLNADTGNQRFLTPIFTPEVETFLEINNSYELAIGITYPISIDRAYKPVDIFVAPLLYLETSFTLTKIAGNIDVGFSLNYYNTFLDLENFGNNIAKNGIIGELFEQSNLVFNSKAYVTFFDTYFISAGIFLAPKYDVSELQFIDNGSQYKAILIPFIDFSLSLN